LSAPGGDHRLPRRLRRRESKAALWTDQPVPCVVVEGRMGGSAITVAAINALASGTE
jgi:precorrin isomerase